MQTLTFSAVKQILYAIVAFNWFYIFCTVIILIIICVCACNSVYMAIIYCMFCNTVYFWVLATWVLNWLVNMSVSTQEFFVKKIVKKLICRAIYYLRMVNSAPLIQAWPMLVIVNLHQRTMSHSQQIMATNSQKTLYKRRPSGFPCVISRHLPNFSSQNVTTETSVNEYNEYLRRIFAVDNALLLQGLKSVNVAGDGNCLFRAAAFLFEGSEMLLSGSVLPIIII